jgi:site-specific recombinase XerD
MRDKGYRVTPIGQEVGRFLRSKRWSEGAENTLLSYETTLARLSIDFAQAESLAEVTTEMLRDFLDEHWSDASAATRRQRLACVRSFFSWAVEERGLASNPARVIKPPKPKHVERTAYKPDMIHELVTAQPTLRDQIGCALLGRLALRRNELRLLKVGDIDLAGEPCSFMGKAESASCSPSDLPASRLT